jgi:tetratricopeptide (TPR) repeat protein
MLSRREARRGLIAAALAGAALCCGATADAQAINVSAQVAGIVRDAASREPVVSARVDLISPNGMAAPTQFTDTDGGFHFNDVADGDYHLTIRKTGYEDAQVVISVVARHYSNVQVDLRKKGSSSDSDSNANSGSGEKISAHELRVPDKARDDCAKGQGLMEKQDYAGAIAAFQKAIQEFPDYYEAYAKMGVAQYMAGQAADSRASLERAIDLSGGKYPEALFDMADVLNDVGDYAGAESLARRDIAIEETASRGHFELARALLGSKKYLEAELSAKKCIELDAQNKNAYVVLTNIHIGMHDYSDAVRDIDVYLKLDAKSAASEQMRATRAQLTKALSNAQPKANPKPQ